MFDFFKHARVAGPLGQRAMYVFIFVMNLTSVVLSVVSMIQGDFDNPLFPFNLAFAIIWGWLAWPTVTGTTADQRASDDNIRNS